MPDPRLNRDLSGRVDGTKDSRTPETVQCVRAGSERHADHDVRSNL